MKDYKWNVEPHGRLFWDLSTGCETIRNLTNKELVNNPDQSKFEDVLRALCMVACELIEIEESGNSDQH